MRVPSSVGTGVPKTGGSQRAFGSFGGRELLPVTPIGTHQTYSAHASDDEEERPGTLPFDHTCPVPWSSFFISAPSAMLLWVCLMHLHVIGKRIGYLSNDKITELTAAGCMVNVGRGLAATLHVFVLGQMSGRARLFAGLLLGLLCVFTIMFCYMMGDKPLSTSIAPMFIAYLLGGLGRGLGESVMYSFMAPYGAQSKRYLVLGYSFGWQFTGVLVFALYTFVGQYPWLLTSVWMWVGMILCAGLYAVTTIPEPCEVGMPQALPTPMPQRVDALNSARNWRAWLPQIKWHVVALGVVATVAGFVTATSQLLYVQPRMTLFPGVHVDPSGFLLAYSFFTFMGSFVASFVAQAFPKPIVVSFVCATLAAVFAMSSLPAMGMISGVLSSFGVATLLTASSPMIDKAVDRDYNLIATTLWMLAGIVGTTLGQFLSGPMRTLINPNATG